jgi:DNA-binding NarL/FixJ family response regulator
MVENFPQPESISVLVVEPRKTSCESLIKGLNSVSSFRKVIGARTIRTAKRMVLTCDCDVALISNEIREPDEGAYNLADFLTARSKPTRPILLAREWHRRAVVEAFRHGAKGLLSAHGIDFRTVCKAIACVHAGQVWANSEQLNFTLDYLVDENSRSGSNVDFSLLLSVREQEIAQFLAKGASNKEIAKELHISDRTVKNHLRNIFGKIGVTSRVQAALRLVG